MPSLISSLESFISSIFGAITAALSSVLAVFQTLINAVIGVFSTLLAAIGNTISGLAHTFEGLIKFVLSNIVVLGAVAAVLFGYAVYQQRNGKTVGQKPAGIKKTA